MLVECGGNGALMHCRWEYKLVQTRCKTIQLVLNICSPYGTQILL